MQKYCLALDLKSDESLIKEYEKYHEDVWPEIIDSIKQSGISNLEIFRAENRLFMIIEASDQFSFEKKSLMDKENLIVQKWEELMWKYQQAMPNAKPGEKWMLMNKIFSLNN